MYRLFCVASKNNFPHALLVEHLSQSSGTVFIIGLPSDSSLTIKGLVKILDLILSHIAIPTLPSLWRFCFYQ